MNSQPIIILVEPQLVENIGMTARAMMNCGLTELRLVDPRDPWPLHEVMEERMTGAASGADSILRNAKLFGTLGEAIADLHYVYATAARTHDMVNRILTPRAAIPDMIARMQGEQKVGVLFGRERTGLTREQIALASAKITIPLNPEFASLNLAQAVLLIGYEWYQAHDKTPDKQIYMGNSRPAERAEYARFFKRLEDELEAHSFFVAGEMRAGMVRSLTNMLQRAEMTEQEIRTWHGVISALIKGPKAKEIVSSLLEGEENEGTGMKPSPIVSLNTKTAREPDRITVFLRDCKVDLSVGYRPHERKRRQAIIAHVEVEAELPHRYQDLGENSLDRVIDYSRIYHFITDELPHLGHIPLLETVAEQIVSFCFEDHRVVKVRVKLEKPEIYEGRARVGIELNRSRAVSSAR